MKKNINYILLSLTVVFASCQNQDWEFPDFDYQTVYFAHQYPVRTITLGEDIFDTSLDNEWKFKIMATTGGVYENDHDITIGVEVDNELAQGLVFSGTGQDVRVMPASYYTLASNQIVIPKGQLTGGVEVQLTEAFFADSLAVGNAYVIPVKMTGVQNADSILSGVPMSAEANRAVPGDWAVQPKDFVFYAVKYINPWHGYYLRRGRDVITGDLDTTIVRHQEFVERDEVNMLTTRSLETIEFPLVLQDGEGDNVDCTLILTFDDDGSCVVSSGTEGYTASGNGSFVKKGEKKSWGDQDRDALYLTYEIDLGSIQVETTDTLVMRNRGVAMEVFTPVQE